MAKRKIRKIGDPVLREKCTEVDKIDKSILDLVTDMVDSVSEGNIGGVGLAAPQIGVLKRVIVVNLEEKFDCFINPEIEIIDREQVIEEEGCLSLYSIRTSVGRPRKIRLKAKNLKGDDVTVEAEGMIARIFLHEVDHLNGVLFIDHLKPEDRKDFLSRLNKDILI